MEGGVHLTLSGTIIPSETSPDLPFALKARRGMAAKQRLNGGGEEEKGMLYQGTPNSQIADARLKKKNQKSFRERK